MPLPASLNLDVPDALALALAAAASLAVAVAVAVRRADVPRGPRLVGALGLLLLTLAAGGLTLLRPDPRTVLVMVDLSPSTRGAAYRDADHLRQRLATLLRDTPHRLLAFADGAPVDLPAASPLPDLPAERTAFAPPPAPAVVLFSDGRFELPAVAPPTFVIADPLLEAPADAAVRRLELRDRTVVASVFNQGEAPRRLTVTGLAGPTLPGPGERVVPARLPERATAAAARFAPGDAWPENDRLGLAVPPPAAAERWWVGGAAPQEYRAISPADLPADAAAYLAPALVVLDNVAAADLDAPRLRRLEQYVRDLGGAMLILGGDRAFAAGGYEGTALDALSPLASSPPTPAVRWVLLADASGSMAAPVEAGRTRFELARDAVLGLLPRLPPADPVSVGGFSDRARWWSDGRSAAETALLPLPPAGTAPGGPTNLEPVLVRLANEADATLPTELLLLTDANAEVRDVAALEQAMRSRRIRLHVLVIGREGERGLKALERLADATGGRVLTELDPRRWSEAVRRLYQQASPGRVETTPAPMRPAGESGLAPRDVAPWNRAWLKPGATTIAEARVGGSEVPLAARWPVGAGGQVVAVAFRPTVGEVEALAKLIARPPRDPRFRITFDPGSSLRVMVEASDGGRFLNDLSFSLELAEALEGGPGPARSLPIPQVAPGRYEVTIDAPRHAVFAAVRHEGRALERAAIAGRYAPEFDAVGNDRAAMERLARRTGGAVVAPADGRRIDFRFPPRPVPLAAWLALAGALCIATALAWWRAGT